MKRNILLFAGLLASCTLFFSSCTEDGTAPTVKIVTLDGVEQNNVTINAGSSFELVISAEKGSADLSEVTIYRDGTPIPASELEVNGSAAASNPFTLTGSDVDGFDQQTYVITTPGLVEAEYDYEVEVKDADGLTQTTTVIVTTTVLTNIEIYSGKLSNMSGPVGTGGLDLDDGSAYGSADPKNEIADTGIDSLATDFKVNWKKKFKPVNGAELRKVSAVSVNFNTVKNRDQIRTIFDNGSGLAVTDAVAEGDMFAVKRGDIYYLIRAKEVVNIPGDSISDPQRNTDYIIFEIKK